MWRPQNLNYLVASKESGRFDQMVSPDSTNLRKKIVLFFLKVKFSNEPKIHIWKISVITLYLNKKRHTLQHFKICENRIRRFLVSVVDLMSSLISSNCCGFLRISELYIMWASAWKPRQPRLKHLTVRISFVFKVWFRKKLSILREEACDPE